MIHCTVRRERRHDRHRLHRLIARRFPRAVNVVPIYCFAYSAYAVKALLCPDMPNNEGSFLPITTSAPLGSIFNPRFPAASGGRGMIGHMMLPAIFMALAAGAARQGDRGRLVQLLDHHLGRVSRAARYSSISFMNAGQGATQVPRRLFGALVSLQSRQHADRGYGAAGAVAGASSADSGATAAAPGGIAAATGCISNSN